MSMPGSIFKTMTMITNYNDMIVIIILYSLCSRWWTRLLTCLLPLARRRSSMEDPGALRTGQCAQSPQHSRASQPRSGRQDGTKSDICVQGWMFPVWGQETHGFKHRLRSNVKKILKGGWYCFWVEMNTHQVHVCSDHKANLI